MDESLHGRTSFAYAVWYVAVLRTYHTARALETGSGQYVRGISLAIYTCVTVYYYHYYCFTAYVAEGLLQNCNSLMTEE